MIEPRNKKDRICGRCKYCRYIDGYKRQRVEQGLTSSVSKKLMHEVEYMDGTYQCCNVDSDNVGLETDYNEAACSDWEEKD